MSIRHYLLMTEGKERGKAWNIAKECWPSTGSHPDLGSIPNSAQAHHQTAQIWKILEATHLKICLFKALYQFLLDLFKEKLLQSSPAQALVSLQVFFRHCWVGMSFKACRCFGNLSIQPFFHITEWVDEALQVCALLLFDPLWSWRVKDPPCMLLF